MGIGKPHNGIAIGLKRGVSARLESWQGLLVVAALVSVAAMNGCVGATSANSTPTPNQPQASFQIAPLSLNFGSVTMGSKASKSATITNTGTETITLATANLSNSAFTISNLSLPFTLPAGQSASFLVWLNGNTAGNASGTLVVGSSDGTNSPSVALSGAVLAAQPKLGLSASSINFGNVTVGSSASQNLVLTNQGSGNLTISSVTINANAVTASGVATPATIPAGQSATLSVKYSPTAAGSLSGSISIASNDSNSPTTSVQLSGTGTIQAVGQLSANPGSLSFGNISVGSNSTLPVTLANTGQAAVHISSVSVTGPGFSVSGLASPATINAGATATLQVRFAPTSGGAASGNVSVASDVQNSPTVAGLSGNGTQPALSVTPGSVNFGSVIANTSKSQSLTISNTGQADLRITSATVTGAGFSVSGISVPVTISAGQAITASANFAPTAAGAATGNLSLASNAPNSPATIVFSGTGTAATFTLSANPASISFGNVTAGSSASGNVTITNTGNSNVTITGVTVSGAGITASGIAGTTTLTPSQTATLTVQFAPASAGSVNGSVKVNASQGSGVTIGTTGTGVQAGLSATPASASFGSVATGSSNSQTIQLKNTGTASLTISQATLTGAGFSLSGLSTPLTLNSGATSNFNVVFAPSSAGSASGSVSLASNAPNSPMTIALSGTAVAATKTLSVSPGSLSFGSVTTGNSSSKNVTITNTGNAAVNISQATVTGTDFSGGASAVSLSPSQNTVVSVQFAPTAAGSVTGTLTIVSDATGSPAVVGLSGTGAAVVPRSVGLTWAASTSTVSGYNIYRSTVAGGAYSKMNSSLVGGLSYSDTTVQGGQTYYYVATAVDSDGNESGFSNEVSANIP